MQQAIKLAEDTNSTAEIQSVPTEDHTKSSQIEQLRAMVAKQSEEIQALKAKGPSGNATSTGGKRNPTSNRNPKRKDQERTALPTCKSCGRQHNGQCVLDSDIDKSYLELQQQGV